MNNQSAQKGNILLILIIIGVVVLLVVVAFVTGLAKLSVKVKGSNGNPGSTSSPTKSLKQEKQEISYENSKYGFSLKYPRKWRKEDRSGSDPVVVFFSPSGGVGDSFRDNVLVTVTDLTSFPGKTSSQVMDAWISENESGQFSSTFKIVSRKSITVSSTDAEQLMYTAGAGEVNAKGMVTIVMKNDKAYIVSYTAEEKSFDAFLDDVLTILNSFKVS